MNRVDKFLAIVGLAFAFSFAGGFARAQVPAGSRGRFGGSAGVATATAPLVITGADVACTGAGAGTSGCLTSTAGNLVVDAGVVITSVNGLISTGPVDATGGVIGRAASSSAQLKAFDTSNSKTWYFINNNNRLQLYGNNGSTIVFDITGDTGEIANLASTKNRGSCTLNGATPATCTSTVLASASCQCTPVGTTAVIAAGGCAVSLSGTTLTITGPATAAYAVNYHCF